MFQTIEVVIDASGQVHPLEPLIRVPPDRALLTCNKFRPALLLADAGRGDWIACQITSHDIADARTIR